MRVRATLFGVAVAAGVDVLINLLAIIMLVVYLAGAACVNAAVPREPLVRCHAPSMRSKQIGWTVSRYCFCIHGIYIYIYICTRKHST